MYSCKSLSVSQHIMIFKLYAKLASTYCNYCIAKLVQHSLLLKKDLQISREVLVKMFKTIIPPLPKQWLMNREHSLKIRKPRELCVMKGRIVKLLFSAQNRNQPDTFWLNTGTLAFITHRVCRKNICSSATEEGTFKQWVIVEDTYIFSGK